MSDPNEPVVVHVAASLAEVELLLSVLRSAGIQCASRASNRTAGIGDGLGTWGPHEVLVRRSDAETARELLAQDDSAT